MPLPTQEPPPWEYAILVALFMGILITATVTGCVPSTWMGMPLGRDGRPPEVTHRLQQIEREQAAQRQRSDAN